MTAIRVPRERAPWGVPAISNRGGTRVLPSITNALGLGAMLTLLVLSQGLPAAEGEGPAPVDTPDSGSESAQRDTDQPVANESPEEVRRRELTETHGAEIADAILAGTVLREMTREQVVLARGEPTRKEVIPPDAELWHYPGGEVAFSGGKVSYVSLPERPEQTPPAADVADAHPPLAPPPRGDAARQAPDPVGGQVGIPPIRVGDTYVYESKDPAQPDASLSTRRTVTSTSGKIVLSSLNLDNKRAKARSLYFDREWNLIGSRSPNNSGRDYSPPLKYYDFPLYPGKTWQQTTTETDIKTGAMRIHQVSGVVKGWETVTVPAGTFRGIRVELETELFDPSTGERVPGTDTSWYVPEVRRSVKSDTTGKGGSRRLIQLISYDVQ